MNAKEILEKAREKIADYTHWTQRAYARDGTGAACGGASYGAVQWCAVGAINAVVEDKLTGDGVRAVNILWSVMGMDPVKYNDSHSYAEVYEKFGEAITQAVGT